MDWESCKILYNLRNAYLVFWTLSIDDVEILQLSLMSVTAVYYDLVALYKRAQILVADIWACCGGTGYGAFSDIDAITAFADYRVPQLLRWFYVLQYSDSLMNLLHNS